MCLGKEFVSSSFIDVRLLLSCFSESVEFNLGECFFFFSSRAKVAISKTEFGDLLSFLAGFLQQ